MKAMKRKQFVSECPKDKSWKQLVLNKHRSNQKLTFVRRRMPVAIVGENLVLRTDVEVVPSLRQHARLMVDPVELFVDIATQLQRGEQNAFD